MDAPLGPTVSLMGSRNPTEFLDGFGAVQALNSSQAEQLEEFSKLSEQLKARRDQLKERKSRWTPIGGHGGGAQRRRGPVQEAKKLFFQMSTAQQAKFMDSDTDLNFEVEASGRTKQAIDFAIAQLGDAYVYGGTGPSAWDCSGLVMKSFAAAGVSLPRVVGPQTSPPGTYRWSAAARRSGRLRRHVAHRHLPGPRQGHPRAAPGPQRRDHRPLALQRGRTGWLTPLAGSGARPRRPAPPHCKRRGCRAAPRAGRRSSVRSARGCRAGARTTSAFRRAEQFRGNSSDATRAAGRIRRRGRCSDAGPGLAR